MNITYNLEVAKSLEKVGESFSKLSLNHSPFKETVMSKQAQVTNEVVEYDELAAAKFVESLNEPKVLNESSEDLIKRLGSKSSAIRYLLSQRMTRGQVAKFLGVRYQHVRNVEITPLVKK